jgi:acyl carrier protein
MRQNGPVLESVTREVRGYILANFLTGDPEDSLSDDDLLLEGGIIDSGSVMSLVLFLEDRFGIRVEDDDLIVENFATVDRIASFVAAKEGVSAPCASS